MAGATGLEPAASGLTGRRYNQNLTTPPNVINIKAKISNTVNKKEQDKCIKITLLFKKSEKSLSEASPIEVL